MIYPEITPLEAFENLADYRVIDVREEPELHGPLGSIEGAELVPLAAVEACAARLKGLQPLLLVCRSGMRSGKACETLQKLGVTDVTNLTGGMIGWNEAGNPVILSDPQTPTVP